jgi:hypothetical protein
MAKSDAACNIVMGLEETGCDSGKKGISKTYCIRDFAIFLRLLNHSIYSWFINLTDSLPSQLLNMS